MKKKPSKIEITEMFGAKAGKNGWDRFFTGIITRNTNNEGNAFLFSKIYIRRFGFNEVLYSRACDPSLDKEKLQDKLGEQLDEMVLMVLDCGLTKLNPSIESYGEFSINLN